MILKWLFWSSSPPKKKKGSLKLEVEARYSIMSMLEASTGRLLMGKFSHANTNTDESVDVTCA